MAERKQVLTDTHTDGNRPETQEAPGKRSQRPQLGMYLWCNIREMQVYMYDLSRKILHPTLIRRKKHLVSFKKHSTKYLVSTSGNCQGHQKEGKSEYQSQPRKAQGDLMSKCHVITPDGILEWGGGEKTLV